MTHTVFVLNGPNLNLLGTREPAVYGAQTLADVQQLCHEACARHGLALVFRQSNHEGELVEWIHEAGRLHAAGGIKAPSDSDIAKPDQGEDRRNNRENGEHRPATRAWRKDGSDLAALSQQVNCAPVWQCKRNMCRLETKDNVV